MKHFYIRLADLHEQLSVVYKRMAESGPEDLRDTALLTILDEQRAAASKPPIREDFRAPRRKKR